MRFIFDHLRHLFNLSTGMIHLVSNEKVVHGCLGGLLGMKYDPVMRGLSKEV